MQEGKRKRMSFARIGDRLDVPDLIAVQKNSYQHFLKVDLKEVLADVSPITDYNESLMLEFVDYKLDDKPKKSIEECKERDQTYAAPLTVLVRLTNKETGETRESNVFIGDFPLMTENGTFIINGAERVIVSQLVRSPGAYYERSIDKAGKFVYATKLIPNRGAWLEYESDANNSLSVRIDRNRKMPLTHLIRALGYGSNAQIYDLLGEVEQLKETIAHDGNVETEERALEEIYKRMRPGEPATEESARKLLHETFYNPKKYDLARVGRYKYNKKLALASRLAGQVLAEDIVNPFTGEVIAKTNTTVSLELARLIQNSGVNTVDIEREGIVLRVVGNSTVDFDAFLKNYDEKLYEQYLAELSARGDNYVNPLFERVYLPALLEMIEDCRKDGMPILNTIEERIALIIPKHITKEDIVSSISYQLTLPYGVGYNDDIDHLGNRRLRSVGELLQNQIRIGMSRLDRIVRERMSTQDPSKVRPQDLINIRPMSAAIKEFFGSSQLSQFMDQPNPLAELTHKRRLSALGPGGLNRDRASFEVRDVHYSHYSRICPIETPEGPNIGLIGSLATFARINEYGFIEAPYRRIDKITHQVVDAADGGIVYMTADEEDNYIIAQATEPLDANNRFVNERVTVRIRDEITEVERDRVDFIDVSPRQLVSVATGMIPFLENDDATRALMGSNMQRQAVPLLVPEAPIVGTGIEYRAACDSGVVILARRAGVVEHVSADQVVIRTEDGSVDQYKLTKFTRSNQGTCINQRPRVAQGEIVRAKQVIADGPSTDEGEIALGRNPLIAFMTWEGYNYEDAVLLSERLVKEDVYTSIHIEEYESEARDTKLGAEEITRDIPNVGDDALRDLDENGIIRVGAEVRAGDILVGKVTPKGETELTAEERLLRAIFGEKAREVRDTSLRVPHGEFGIIVDVKEFTRENHDELAPGVNRMVRVYIAQKRKIQVGDKMAGRHGNKGVVSRIMPEEDMPFLPDGTPVDIVLNPLGVPSRMNIGQVLEIHLGLAAKALGWHVATPIFDGANENDIQQCLIEASKVVEPSTMDENGKPIIQFSKCGLSPDGKVQLYDGRTGDPFDHRVTVGYMYYLKLHHLVDDKIHARSTGPYSMVTQQPLGGKAQFGGQRFGEMEVWALYAYGASHVLQEILTVKSDDMVGRVKTFEAIVKGENIPAPGIPESFRVLMKELQSLGLDIKALDENKNVLDMREMDDDLPGTQEVNIREDAEAGEADEDAEDTMALMGGMDIGMDEEEFSMDEEGLGDDILDKFDL